MPAPTEHKPPAKETLTIPDAVATALGVVLAIVIIFVPGGDDVHKLLPGIIGPATLIIRYGIARWVRRTSLRGGERDLRQLREIVARVEMNPDASPDHKKRMRALLEAAEERHAIDLTQ